MKDIQYGAPMPRLEELDVLRGFALLGVFIVHFVGLAFYELPTDEDVLFSWLDNPLHSLTVLASDLLFLNKANTLFATLFGIGFWIMLERFQQSGRDFRALYLRRLGFLFCLGVVNVVFIFPGDVLHEYALIGLILFLLRRIKPSTMLLAGILFALAARPLLESDSMLGFPADTAIQMQYDAIGSGNYSVWLQTMVSLHVKEEILHGGILAWVFYVLGRFFIGSWLVRKQLIYSLAEKTGWMKRHVRWVLPLGLLIELLTTLMWEEVIISPVWLREALHYIGVPMVAVGYALALFLLYHSSYQSLVKRIFAPVGRIALTAYIGHCVIYAVLFLPLGFNLLSVVAPFTGLLIALGVFALFNLLGTFSLHHFGYGPLEYLWRWATYGRRPMTVKSM
ncbi:DUF418 domain-containing protein [Alteromonas sp. H39]|uniref:DUF418 domain-containing protein n=1 Tax=Alteromonas sp. H39 TaxID=3389876 RepID=UPI0039E16C56